MPRLMSFASTVSAFETGMKIVTRRDGWRFLRPGDAIEGTEWLSRVGPRWVCSCGHRGPTDDRAEPGECPIRCQGTWSYREPRRLGVRTVRKVSRERLSDITGLEIAFEGFPGMSREVFLGFFKPPYDREITRIEFEPVWTVECCGTRYQFEGRLRNVCIPCDKPGFHPPEHRMFYRPGFVWTYVEAGIL